MSGTPKSGWMDRMEYLVSTLESASNSYYNLNVEIMSNYMYDKMFNELVELENSTGIRLNNSPTLKVGSVLREIPGKVDSLTKVTHKFPAKSLAKTKDIDKFVDTFRVSGVNQTVTLSWKLDGSTVQLTYADGVLVNAATRGDGEVGQDITHNAKSIRGIPIKIDYKGNLVVRGEGLMSYGSFNQVNDSLPEDERFENPRNLASATLTMRDPSIVNDRKICFRAFELVYCDDARTTFSGRFQFLKSLGFGVVDYIVTDTDHLADEMTLWGSKVSEYEFPVDGLVCVLDDVEFTRDLKGTEHHPHPLKGFAFKWKDETAETVLREIRWQPSRTGLLNPVAIFDPVRLEGTTVEKAYLHNMSIMRSMHLRVGDTIEVYKANKIIPQVADNLSGGGEYTESDIRSIIGKCPCCGENSVIRVSPEGIESVYCDNPNCNAKKLDAFVHFCSRGAMNILGLSEATLSKFLDEGIIKEFPDIYKLDRYKDNIISWEGFGEKSWDSLWESIQNSRTVDFVGFVTALGIPGVGQGQAKTLKKAFEGDIARFLNSCNPFKDKTFDFTSVESFGPVLDKNIKEWLKNYVYYNGSPILELLHYVKVTGEDDFKTQEGDSPKPFADKTFVVTGKVVEFKNRDEIHSFIESHGGKTSGSVSKNTSYLVNNDIESTSGKNKKAKELGIPIISEKDLIGMVSGGN